MLIGHPPILVNTSQGEFKKVYRAYESKRWTLAYATCESTGGNLVMTKTHWELDWVTLSILGGINKL
jgi:hypothetical protein